MEPVNQDKVTNESESLPSVTSEKVTPELTLVLFGDPDAVEPGPNLLLDPDKENEQFSSSLYDLCGRVISVINLLGLQNTDHVPSDKGINAFLLLLPHGLHVSQYRSGVQWLESSFGKGALDYLMTVVTHEPNEKCDRAVTDLKDCSGFAAERFCTCTKHLRVETEILALLEKIDAMVSENEPQSYTRPQSDRQEGEEAGSLLPLKLTGQHEKASELIKDKKEQLKKTDEGSEEESDINIVTPEATPELLSDPNKTETDSNILLESDTQPLSSHNTLCCDQRESEEENIDQSPQVTLKPTAVLLSDTDASEMASFLSLKPDKDNNRQHSSNSSDEEESQEERKDSVINLSEQEKREAAKPEIKNDDITSVTTEDEDPGQVGAINSASSEVKESKVEKVEESSAIEDTTRDTKEQLKKTDEGSEEESDINIVTPEATPELLSDPNKNETDSNILLESDTQPLSSHNTLCCDQRESEEENIDQSPQGPPVTLKPTTVLLSDTDASEMASFLSLKPDKDNNRQHSSNSSDEEESQEERKDSVINLSEQEKREAAKPEIKNDDITSVTTEDEDPGQVGAINSASSEVKESKVEKVEESSAIEDTTRDSFGSIFLRILCLFFCWMMRLILLLGEKCGVRLNQFSAQRLLLQNHDFAMDVDKKEQLKKTDEGSEEESDINIVTPEATPELLSDPNKNETDSNILLESDTQPLSSHNTLCCDQRESEEENIDQSPQGPPESKVDELEDRAAVDNTKLSGNEEPDNKKQNDNKTNSASPENCAVSQLANKDRDEYMENDKEKKVTMEQHWRKKTEELLSRLCLQYNSERKLTSAEFLQISPALKQDQDICESDLSSVYLHKLLFLDYRARYIHAKQQSSNDGNVGSNDGNVEDYNETDDNDFFSTNEDSVAQPQQTNIHPLDVQMAVFHCSDSFLKQKMVTKLSQCQYALPLLVPDPFTENIECPLWTFREIEKTWKKIETKDNSKTVSMKSMPICKAETPMVFCFRLGSPSVSKSQLINTLINDRHSTFFHRNCPGSTKTRLLFDGVAEIAWYCPAGKPNDTFTDCVAFCNLHGDGLTYDKQMKILVDKSSVNVVLVPNLNRKHESAAVISGLLESPKPLIVLIEDNGRNAFKSKEGKYRLGLKDRSQSDVSQELKRIIRDFLSGPHESFQLESMSESGFRVDENNICCKEGLSFALKMMTTIKSVNVSEIKSNFLPCQGQLWHDWCRINKEQYRLKGHVENDKCEKQNELQKLREDQCKVSCSKLMKTFIRHLSSLPSTEKEYFLKWTQILLDAHATDYLSSILQSYDRNWSDVMDLKKKPDKSNELKSKQAELEQISTKLQSATCGLEHIFREMGQIYEAHKSLEKPPKMDQTDWSKYPELAAELMISGHPMELMDGDAGHVPLTWISSLIDEVIKKLARKGDNGDKKVFVLSVLGIQSSGKSTMLNAMFGLQFAVSAGRCTRGAFMQLVKLSEDMRKDFQWDYILVVDTEGLRALELEGNATIHHDNELATFVVGLGNMTLVNIFGENPSEMQDVLQIVVQAFMRMKKVRLSPSCVFVHQNVTDVGAAEKNLDGKRKLQDKLDQMAQLAAKEEVCDADSFSDVSEFDVQKDVKYFAQLWEGSPPMAPPNPGYSESVQDLKSFILSKASVSPGVTLSEFKTKVQDLWNALINDNFVFSFKNTLEIAVYRKLEIEYGNWTWALRSEMLNIENQLYTRIENGTLHQVDLSYLYREVSKKYDEIKKSMSVYFDSEKDKEMLVQWKGQHELKIKDFLDGLVRGLQRKLSDVIEQKKTSKEVEEKKTIFEGKLLQNSKELAHQLKDKANDDEALKDNFNHVWEDWVTELTQGTKPIENINLEEDQTQVIHEHGFEWELIMKRKNAKSYKDLLELGDYTAYVGQKRHKRKDERRGFMKTLGNVVQYLTGRLPHEDQEQIRGLIHAVEKQSLELILSKPVAVRGHSSTYLSEMCFKVMTNVAEFESQWKYPLMKEFTVDLILYVFDRTESWIVKSHAQFIKNNDARTYLESKKDEYYSVFRSFCKGSSSAVVLAELICDKLKASMTEYVGNQTAIDIAGEMKCSVKAFSENRLNLEKNVLMSLAEKREFHRYITYIKNPKTYIETFIREEVKKHLDRDDSNKYHSFFSKNVSNIKSLMQRALNEASEKTKTQTGDINMWLQEFTGLIKDKLKFGTISSQNFSDVNKFDFLREVTEKGLDPIIEEIKQLPLEKLQEFRQQPDQILIDQLCDCCWETCPFCGAVCTNTVKDHDGDHSVPFHRSPSVNGMHYRGLKDLSLPFCTTEVAGGGSFYPDASDRLVPFKKYREGGPKFEKWSITPDLFKLSYWQWVVCAFKEDIEKYYNLQFTGHGEIPKDWKKIEYGDAVKSLEDMYK